MRNNSHDRHAEACVCLLAMLNISKRRQTNNSDSLIGQHAKCVLTFRVAHTLIIANTQRTLNYRYT